MGGSFVCFKVIVYSSSSSKNHSLPPPTLHSQLHVEIIEFDESAKLALCNLAGTCDEIGDLENAILVKGGERVSFVEESCFLIQLSASLSLILYPG